MDNSFMLYSEWVTARRTQVTFPTQASCVVQKAESKWQVPEPGSYKLNVDASVFPNAQFFSVGMVMRDHLGSFIACKVGSFPMVDSVFEAELIGVREALSWIKEGQYGSAKVLIESDSLLSIDAIQKDKINLLEVGEVIEECKQGLQSLPSVSVRFIRKIANRVAHSVAKKPMFS
ncbi:uncharacterized protein LOC141690759 [Apium graveolens]|uniref:uncharacterized protein LOC141690759 n=1 Tax=Apium graveolens TaxID=4045 RepID=UPI003D7A4250